jgi:hypothetical protein
MHRGRTPPRFKRTEQHASHTMHTLAVNDVLISAELLDRRYDQVSLVAMEHEWEFKRNPFRLDAGSVAPDGLLRLTIGGEPADVLLELDHHGADHCGTETKAQWQHKITKLFAFVQGFYQQRYDTPFAPAIAVLTTADETRREHLREWTAEIDAADLCLFSSADRKADPDILFGSPVWDPRNQGAAESLVALP